MGQRTQPLLTLVRFGEVDNSSSSAGLVLEGQGVWERGQGALLWGQQ